MKRIFTLFTALALFAFVGCDETPEHNFGPGNDDPQTQNPTDPNATAPASDEIWYTSTNGQVVDIRDESGFGVKLESNTYVGGRGVMKFSGDLTVIGEKAFYGSDYLVTVTLPEGLQQLDGYCFTGCVEMTSINIPESVVEISDGALAACYKLTELTIGNNVKSIGYQSINNCTALKKVTLGESVESIGSYAFGYCESLESITIPESVTSLSPTAFYNCSSLSKFMGKYASEDGRYLSNDGVLMSVAPAGMTEFAVPDGIVEIALDIFGMNTVIEKITMPNTVVRIGEYAFHGCSNLKDITLSESLTTIDEWAFAECTSLTSITLPESLTTIGLNVFKECSSLKEFKGKFATEDGCCLVMNGVLAAFAQGSTNDYTIPAGITTIGDSAFGHCAGIENVTIENDVTVITMYAFFNCKNLKTITIGSDVMYIGANAFNSCEKIEAVYCKPTTPPECGKYVFEFRSDHGDQIINGTIYVPTESVEAYKAAPNWSDYAEIIQGYDF